MYANTNHPIRVAMGTMLLLSQIACMNTIDTPVNDFSVDPKGEATKELPWGPSDDPSVFSDDLTYTLADLPREGAPEQAPWTGTYWPTYKDSINVKWDGEDSLPPSTKYGQAYGVDGVEDAVSRMRGVASQAHRTECSADDDCKEENGEQCAKREGEEKGSCIPTWFGICHAWAPAAILTPEPKYPVTENGVEFKVNDIKALVTLAHDSVITKFVSLRCNTDDGEGEGKIEYDEYGRPVDGRCMDTNPATLHLLVTNYLGLQRQSFVMDRTFDDEVWNQPLHSYEITKQDEVTYQEANALIGATSIGGETNTEQVSLEKDEWTHFDAKSVTEGQSVKVRMEGTGDADLYVHFGAQPTREEYTCRPYVGTSEEECTLDVPAGATELFISVHGYAAAEVSVHSTVGGTLPTEYLFNDGAERFYHVKMNLKYIGESEMHEDGNLSEEINRFVFTDRIEYVLELDSDGRLLGGEYIGDSKRAHPDFLWLPIRHRYNTVASGKIQYSKVMDLLNRSLIDPQVEEDTSAGGPVSITESGDVGRFEMLHFGPFSTAEGTQFIATMTGTGDADLYVRRGAAPTLHHYDCRPYKSGSNETCAVEGVGDIFVAVHGYQEDNTFSLSIDYVEPGGNVASDSESNDSNSSDPSSATVHLDVEGEVSHQSFDYYTVDVQAGETIVIRTEAPQDIDVYVQMGQQPTTSTYSALAYTMSGHETIRFTPTTTGTLHIGVYGYAASTYRLTTDAQ